MATRKGATERPSDEGLSLMDSLEGMPEFDKPENIPLVVPDEAKPNCQATKKDGSPCSVHPLKGEKYCLGHSKSLSPELRAKWSAKRTLPAVSRRNLKAGPYKSREEILSILSQRLDLVLEKWGTIADPNIEERICDLCRTMAVVMKVEVAGDGKVKGWRIPEAG